MSFPQPSLQVEVPGSKVMVQAGGLDVALNLPNTKLDLGSMPTFSATLNTDSNDAMHAILFPCILAVVTVPFVIMRAAMMELDCFVARKKQLGEGDVTARSRSRSFRSVGGDEVDGFVKGKFSLTETIQKNVENKELKTRLYLTVCCSMLGMCIFSGVLIVTCALIVLNFK